MESEIGTLRQENARLMARITGFEAEKMELKRELNAKSMSCITTADFSSKIDKLNAEIVELEKNKSAIIRLESENAEFRVRFTGIWTDDAECPIATQPQREIILLTVHLTSIQSQANFSVTGTSFTF
ncbi:hypothetical protein C1646_757628 [Rhizophagus diaphanus]|nr:hypothetical protein C1646_757628 [Rhizophagus diaphanus] [Rhizophagus sp. MUCL 43196]